MGRTAILLVIGLGITFGIISNSIRGTMETLTESNVGYNKYSFARNMARTGIHRLLRNYDINDPVNFPVHESPTPNLFSFKGSVDTVYLTTHVDTVWMRSTGVYADTSYTMNVKLQRSTKPFFAPDAAMEVKATINTLGVSGKPSIDGRNYDITGTTLVGSGNMPGITVTNPSDTNDVKGVLGGGSNGLQLTGNPNYKVSSGSVDPKDFINEYWESADYKCDLNHIPAGPWGTVSPLNPKITFIDAGTDTTNAISLTGGTSGCGILVLRGNVKIAGNFSFTGLVIFDGTTTIFNVTENGTANITGGLIISGNAVNVSLKGTGSNGKIQYSSAALDAAKNIGKLRYYKIMEWYE